MVQARAAYQQAAKIIYSRHHFLIVIGFTRILFRASGRLVCDGGK